MTKIWREASDSEQYTEAQILDMENHLDAYMAVMGCQSMKGHFPDTTVKILTDDPPTDYFDSGGMFIVSNRLKSVLEQWKVHCEFFRLHILYRGKDYKEHDFYYCNLLDCVECLDLTHGEYTYWDNPEFADHVDKIKKLAIDEKKAAAYALFRIAKGGEHIVCVNDGLATRIEELHLTGVRFVSPEDWGLCS